MTQNYTVISKLTEEDKERFTQINDMKLGSNALLQQIIGGLQNIEKYQRENWLQLAEKHGFDPTDQDIHIHIADGELRRLIQPERVEYIAHFAHEMNRAYCASMGDDSQPAWENAPKWQKDSVINGVNFHLNNDVTPEQSHENWLKQKEAEGWTWGPIKDPEAKTHPCYTEYENLPVEQRSKDYLFKAVVEFFKKQQ